MSWQIYKLKKDRLDTVMERYGKSMAERMYEVSEIFGKELHKRFKKLVMEFPLLWEDEGIQDEPF